MGPHNTKGYVKYDNWNSRMYKTVNSMSQYFKYEIRSHTLPWDKNNIICKNMRCHQRFWYKESTYYLLVVCGLTAQNDVWSVIIELPECRNCEQNVAGGIIMKYWTEYLRKWPNDHCFGWHYTNVACMFIVLYLSRIRQFWMVASDISPPNYLQPLMRLTVLAHTIQILFKVLWFTCIYT